MQQLNCVSLLLLLGILLAALCPLVAAAHRELPMATDGEKGADQVMADQAIGVGGIRTKPETAVKDAEEEVIRRREGERENCHFRTRKLPSDVKIHFDGRMPFTADYHPVHRHPPKHN